ncbi:MAG TPA: hypothetical protein DCM86_15800 [Verrucomicrobiales bacterium]|nr:hypothetical protein [Verrucomicrobiales bacterium]
MAPDRNTSVIRLSPSIGGSWIDTVGTDGDTVQPLTLGPRRLLTLTTTGSVGIGTGDDYRNYASRVLAIQGDAAAARFPGTAALVLGNPVNNTTWSIGTFTTGDLFIGGSGAGATHVRVRGELIAGVVTTDTLASTNGVVDCPGLRASGEVTCTALNITSDRNAKEGFKPVDAREVLDKLARLPITEWQYKSQADVRHIGPMAQDFRAAFAVGRDERHITTVDADGVALAAIQGLNGKLEERLAEKEAELGALKAENEALAGRLAAIERALGMAPVPAAKGPRP